MFCNRKIAEVQVSLLNVAILVLLDYVLQFIMYYDTIETIKVAILVLLDYVLQYLKMVLMMSSFQGRNPCFIRLCFAMLEVANLCISDE